MGRGREERSVVKFSRVIMALVVMLVGRLISGVAEYLHPLQLFRIAYIKVGFPLCAMILADV